MKAITLRLNELGEKRIKDLQKEEGFSTGSKVLEHCLNQYKFLSDRLFAYEKIMAEKDQEIEELKNTIKHLR